MRPWDSIVIGLGVMGSATAAALAQRGARVLGLEAFSPLHTEGSSHGRSRIIREAYFESPAYVPLVRRAYALWRELEERTGRRLLELTGILNIGRPDSAVFRGALESSQQHGIAHEVLEAADVMRRFPAIMLPPEYRAVYEPTGGVLDPEACVASFQAVARADGATLRFQEPVTRWEATADGVRVETTRGVEYAEKLVVTPGPWAPRLLADVGVPLQVLRQVNVFFEPDDPERFAPDRLPIYLLDVEEGDYYGFPLFPGQGVKFGRHDGGEPCTAETVRRAVSAEEIRGLQEVLNRYLPGAGVSARETVTCLYTMTPDGHFVIDRHPAWPQVVIGCGFSGHGFKFATVVGEILADLALEGSTSHPIDFLSLARFRGGAATAAGSGQSQ